MASEVPRSKRFTREFQTAEVVKKKFEQQAQATANNPAQDQAQQELASKYDQGTLTQAEFNSLFKSEYQARYGNYDGLNKSSDALSYAYYKYKVSKGQNLSQEEEKDFAISGAILGKQIRNELGGGLNKVIVAAKQKQGYVGEGNYSPATPASTESDFTPASQIPASFVPENQRGSTFVSKSTGKVFTETASSASGGTIATEVSIVIPTMKPAGPNSSTEKDNDLLKGPKDFLASQYQTGLDIQKRDPIAGFTFNLVTGALAVPVGAADLVLNPGKTYQGIKGFASGLTKDAFSPRGKKTFVRSVIEENVVALKSNAGYYLGTVLGSIAFGKIAGKILEPTEITIRGSSTRRQLKGLPGGPTGVTKSTFKGTIESKRGGIIGETLAKLGKKGSILEQILTKKEPVVIKQAFVAGKFGKLEKYGQEASAATPKSETLLDVRAIGRTAEAELKPQAEAIKLQIEEGLKVRTTGTVEVGGSKINVGSTTKQSTNDLVGHVSKNEKYFPSGTVEREAIASRKGKLGVTISSGPVEQLANRDMVKIATGEYTQRAKGVKVEGGPYSGFAKVQSKTKATLKVGRQNVTIIERTKTYGVLGKKTAILERQLGEQTARKIDIALKRMTPYRARPFNSTLTLKFYAAQNGTGASMVTKATSFALETTVPVAGASVAPQVLPKLAEQNLTRRTVTSTGVAQRQASTLSFQERVQTRPQERSMERQSLKPSIVSIQRPVVESLTEPATKSAIVPITRPITKPATKSATIPALIPATVQMTQPITQPVTQAITKPLTKPVTSPVSIPVVRPSTGKRRNIGRQGREEALGPAYAVQTRRRGKIVTLPGRFTRRDALAYGSRVAAGTLRASFRIVRTLGVAKEQWITPATTPFYRSKRNGFLVEPRGYRLKTRSETSEIQGFKAQKRGLRL